MSEANERFLNRQNGEPEERITDFAFYIKEQPDKWYHVECQSTADHTMVIRMFEYDSQIALHHHELLDTILRSDNLNAAYKKVKSSLPRQS